tara:strand:- start:96 stop:419 length:324 start_codon:yes stop_codon:yes gene_type:complete
MNPFFCGPFFGHREKTGLNKESSLIGVYAEEQHMNIGLFDRVTRLSTGLGVVLFDYVASAGWEVVFLLFGAWSVMTSVFGWCPFYRVFGVNTCPTSFKATPDAGTEG